MSSKITTAILSLIMLTGLYLIIKPQLKVNLKTSQQASLSETNTKASALKNYLLQQPKPQRIEIFSYSKKFETDINELKKLKIPQDQSSNTYITIQFFTDEDDPKAPLIAQIRTLDVKTKNLEKEESINLE